MKKQIRNDIVIALILFSLTCIFFWKVLLNPDKMIYPALDIVFIDNYWKLFISESFRTYGELPLWIPLTQSGNTFIGNMQSALFYPTILLYLFFNTDLVYGFVFLIDVFLAGFFMYLFMKTLGLKRYSSLFSAIVFMFSGFLISKIYMGAVYILDSIIWIPLIFLFFELAIKKQNLVYAMLGGVPLGLQILAGHQQYPAYTLFALFLYFVFNLTFIPRKINRKKIVL